MPFKTINIEGTPPAFQLAERGEVCTLINSSSVNSITIGSEQTVQPNDTKSVPFAPGQVLSVDGSSEVWGVLLPNQTAAVLKFPGTTQISGTTPQIPATNSPLVTIAKATSGSTVDIIGLTQNPTLLAVQLLTLSISSFIAANTVTSSFNVEDKVTDTGGQDYLAMQLGLPDSSSPQLFGATLGQDMKNVIVPAGRKLQLVNGGLGSGTATGFIHQIAATVVYYLVGAI